MKDFDVLDLSLSEEEKEVISIAHEVCKKEIIPRRAEMDEKEIFPHEVFEKFKEVGLFSALFPEEYGGMGYPETMSTYLGEVVAEY